MKSMHIVHKYKKWGLQGSTIPEIEKKQTQI